MKRWWKPPAKAYERLLCLLLHYQLFNGNCGKNCGKFFTLRLSNYLWSTFCRLLSSERTFKWMNEWKTTAAPNDNKTISWTVALIALWRRMRKSRSKYLCVNWNIFLLSSVHTRIGWENCVILVTEISNQTQCRNMFSLSSDLNWKFSESSAELQLLVRWEIPMLLLSGRPNWYANEFELIK